MRKIIYILISAALLCGCEKFYGSFDDASQEFVEIAAINRSSMPVSLNVYGADWADPQDTIFLKPKNGLWKIEKSRGDYYGQEILPIRNSVIRADFNNGERIVYFDYFSSLPHNPCAGWGSKEVWDDIYQHKIIEFNDRICEDVFAEQDSLHLFDISVNFSPSDAVEDLVVPGSTEGYFTSLFPVAGIREKVKLGSVLYSEAESIDKVRFVDDLRYEADTLEITLDTTTRYHHSEIYPYYDLDQLSKLGLTNFGCDFAALTGRADGKFDSFCGVVFLQVQVGQTERILDRVHPEEFVAALADLPEQACVVDRVEYGNFMILLAEADCSHLNIHTYVQQKLLREDPSEYYYYYDIFTPEIRFHLITLDDNGSFTCQTGGEELAAAFYNGYDSPALHPLSFHVESLTDDLASIHVVGK